HLAARPRTSTHQRDTDLIDEAKTFITNCINADRYVVASRTGPQERHRGISLIVVEDGIPGFSRGQLLDKIRLHSQDSAELFFDGVRVPADNLIGEEGQGFGILMRNLEIGRASSREGVEKGVNEA